MSVVEEREVGEGEREEKRERGRWERERGRRERERGRKRGREGGCNETSGCSQGRQWYCLTFKLVRNSIKDWRTECQSFGGGLN